MPYTPGEYHYLLSGHTQLETFIPFDIDHFRVKLGDGSNAYTTHLDQNTALSKALCLDVAANIHACKVTQLEVFLNALLADTTGSTTPDSEGSEASVATATPASSTKSHLYLTRSVIPLFDACQGNGQAPYGILDLFYDVSVSEVATHSFSKSLFQGKSTPWLDMLDRIKAISKTNTFAVFLVSLNVKIYKKLPPFTHHILITADEDFSYYFDPNYGYGKYRNNESEGFFAANILGCFLNVPKIRAHYGIDNKFETLECQFTLKGSTAPPSSLRKTTTM